MFTESKLVMILQYEHMIFIRISGLDLKKRFYLNF